MDAAIFKRNAITFEPHAAAVEPIRGPLPSTSPVVPNHCLPADAGSDRPYLIALAFE